MKLTKQQLKIIIKEELESVMTETDRPDLETYKKAMNVRDLKNQPDISSVAQGDDLDQALNPPMESDAALPPEVEAMNQWYAANPGALPKEIAAMWSEISSGHIRGRM